jgi:hypothetical protein
MSTAVVLTRAIMQIHLFLRLQLNIDSNGRLSKPSWTYPRRRGTPRSQEERSFFRYGLYDASCFPSKCLFTCAFTVDNPTQGVSFSIVLQIDLEPSVSDPTYVWPTPAFALQLFLGLPRLASQDSRPPSRSLINSV